MGWKPTASGLLVRDNGTDVGTRPAVNFHAGSGISLTFGDDAANNEVDVTITNTGGGGGGSAMDALRAQVESAIVSGVPSTHIDTKYTSGGWIALVYFGTSSGTTWTAAATTHTVTAGKTLYLVAMETNEGIFEDYNNRRVRLRNVTDGTDVVPDNRKKSYFVWEGDLGAEAWPSVAAGKQIQIEKWGSNADQRAVGVIYYCVEV